MTCRPQEMEPPLRSRWSSEGIATPPAIPSPRLGPDSHRRAAAPTSGDLEAGGPVASEFAMGAVFIDLDRTLLRQASGQVLNAALVAQGVLPEGRSLPG